MKKSKSLIGRIADHSAEFVPAREWMHICFELDLLKACKKAIWCAAVNSFGCIANTASISQCFMTKHCKKIEVRGTLLFKILFNKKAKYHTALFLSFLCQAMI